MRALVLSDIHGNLEALDAVLEAAHGLWDQLWNLGDIVGYGGSPNQAVERMRTLATLNVRGNHDRVCCGLTSPNGFNPVARAAALWTRSELSEDNTAWLKAVPQGPLQTDAGATCAHGSPLHEDHYILNLRDAWAPLKQMTTPVTFFGHTHVQGGFCLVEERWQEVRPRFGPILQQVPGKAARVPATAQAWTYALAPETRHLLNPGSVGQPRDHDWRAAFALFDSDAMQIVYHRVPYDLVASQGRILMANLPERLATRLREGQ